MPATKKFYWLFFVIVIALFIMPFFWYKPGVLDMGADSSRLYFYDPAAYLGSTGLFSIEAIGTAKIASNQYFIPLLTLLKISAELLKSPPLLAVLEKSVKLSLSFIFIFLIIREILSAIVKKISPPIFAAAIIGGLFYTLSPAMTGNMLDALLIHDEMFLNPLVFYLLLRYCLTQKSFFLWLTVLITFIFAPNFSLGAPPPLFSFYPLALFFLFLIVTRLCHKPFPWRGLIMGGFVMAGLNAFHLIPVAINVLNPASYLHARAFEASSQGNPGLEYFKAISGLGKVSTALFLPFDYKLFQLTAIIPAAIIIAGFILARRKSVLMLTGIFFLITLYLESANITHIGVSFYRLLFGIPGFGMFRNFVGQWQFVYTFFYAMLLGEAADILLSKLKAKYAGLVFITVALVLMVRVWPFISGETMNAELTFARHLNSAIKIDPRYDQTLSFLRSLPKEGKVLSLPLTDFYMQVLRGNNNGVYLGPSSVSYLAGKKDFSGYQDLAPFPEVLMRLSREKKFDDIRKLLALLNIRYIFHNSDPEIYDTAFPGFPYAYMRTSLPKSQAEYATYINELGAKKIYVNGPYQVFDLGQTASAPIISIPQTVYIYQNDRNDWYGQNMSFFSDHSGSPPQVSYLLKDTCLKFFPNNPCHDKLNIAATAPHSAITVINPTKYKVSFKNMDHPFVLVLSNAYDPSWNIYLNNVKPPSLLETMIGDITGRIFGDKQIFQTTRLLQLARDRHFLINGYANAWLIKPTELNNSKNELIIETQAQETFYMSAIISSVAMIVFIFWGIFLAVRHKMV